MTFESISGDRSFCFFFTFAASGQDPAEKEGSSTAASSLLEDSLCRDRLVISGSNLKLVHWRNPRSAQLKEHEIFSYYCELLL